MPSEDGVSDRSAIFLFVKSVSLNFKSVKPMYPPSYFLYSFPAVYFIFANSTENGCGFEFSNRN